MDNRKRNNKVNIKKDTKPKEKNIILKTFKVSKESELLSFLYTKITNDSKNNIKHLLSNHQVLVNGTMQSQFNFIIYKEDVVTILKNKINKENNPKIKLDIIYEDDELIVINKPSGLLSIESDNVKQDTAYRALQDYIQKNDKRARVFTVHRIDKDTSGVLVVAKNEKIKEKLQHNWQNIVTKREYIAICDGTFKDKKGVIKSYLKKNVNNLMYSTNDKQNGKLAITNYEVIKSNNKYSLVDVNIDSGRKNQIRVHMKDLGHPVIGDDKYGNDNSPINRLGLHAYVLELIHPETKKKMKFVAKIPSSFDKLFKKNNE